MPLDPFFPRSLHAQADSPPVMNIKLTLEYDGTNYCGWQIQPNGPTIQQVLEQAIEKILGIGARLTAAGRTDAGVHALGQVANFTCFRSVDLYRLQSGLNAVTPPDITVAHVEAAAGDFDARRDARRRIYQYRIWNGRWPTPFHRNFSWHVRDRLDLSAMKEAIKALEGEHDFTSFQAAGCDAAHPVRRIYRNTLIREGAFLVYTVEATAFLRHMVRNIAGTLVEVGRGERSPQEFAALLEARDRAQAGATAPPRGLCLLAVRYGSEQERIVANRS